MFFPGISFIGPTPASKKQDFREKSKEKGERFHGRVGFL
jgi:hypothetical protein